MALDTRFGEHAEPSSLSPGLRRGVFRIRPVLAGSGESLVQDTAVALVLPLSLWCLGDEIASPDRSTATHKM